MNSKGRWGEGVKPGQLPSVSFIWLTGSILLLAGKMPGYNQLGRFCVVLIQRGKVNFVAHTDPIDSVIA